MTYAVVTLVICTAFAARGYLERSRDAYTIARLRRANMAALAALNRFDAIPMLRDDDELCVHYCPWCEADVLGDGPIPHTETCARALAVDALERAIG